MGRTVIVACKVPNGLLICGTNVLGPAKVESKQLVSGFALTPVDADAWDEWLKANAKSDVVTNGLIFAEANVSLLRARIRERRGSSGAANPMIYGNHRGGRSTFSS